MATERKVILLILDGVGLSPQKQHNALFLAQTPYLDHLLKTCLHSQLQASGEAVGLPSGVMGNSEVGHLTIGSGRILLQDLPKISNFIAQKSFMDLPDLQRIGQSDGCVHLIGLVSDGGVHSSIHHLKALVRDIRQEFPHKKVAIHVITDGRDTPPASGLNYILELEKWVAPLKDVVISSVMGRFYAMDRDKRWERTQQAYQNFIGHGDFPIFSSASQGIRCSYEKAVQDEFIKPLRVQGGLSLQSQDQCVIFNFRADRVRQISEALAREKFDAFETPLKIAPHNFVTFTEYRNDFHFPVLFKRAIPANCLGDVVAQRGLRQLRIAETEKYAHVTYFFNGGQEVAFKGEDRILVPSPKQVKTYNEKPEMSAYEITEQVILNMSSDKYSLLIVNFANGDMVGHTGDEKATVKAIEVMDECLGRIVDVARQKNYDLLITSDHGNCEQMVCSKTHQPFTQHTTNPVPLIWVSPRTTQKDLRLLDGGLADIAPTLLHILEDKKPQQLPEGMTGSCLIEEYRYL